MKFRITQGRRLMGPRACSDDSSVKYSSSPATRRDAAIR